MITDNELLIKGIETRQAELTNKFKNILSVSQLKIYSSPELNSLVELQKEYQELETRLYQINANYIPF